ncbi:hypothetical protein GGF32_009340 [Allomyces javanicus]|nr:hypothetical protein GGF32_009340 [Allomyces javanicus]
MPPAKRAASTDQAGSTSPTSAPRRSSRLQAKRTGSIDVPHFEQLTPTPRRRTTRAESTDAAAPTSPTPAARGARGGKRKATGARSPTSDEHSDDGHEQLAEHDEAHEGGHRVEERSHDDCAVELAAAAAEVLVATTTASSTAPPSPPRTVSVDVRCASGEDDVATVSAAPARRSDGDVKPVVEPSIPATDAADTAPAHDAPPSPRAPVSLPAPAPKPADPIPSLPPLNVSFEPTLPKAPVEPLLSLFAAASVRNPLGLARPPSPKPYFPKTDLVPVVVPPAPPRPPKRAAPAPATPAPASTPAQAQFATPAAVPRRIDLFATPRPPRQQQPPAAPATPAPASTPATTTWSCFADWGGATPRPGALTAAPATPAAWPVAFTATAESPLGSPAGTPRMGRKFEDATPRPHAIDATPRPSNVAPHSTDVTPRPVAPSSRPALVPLPTSESGTSTLPAAAAAVARSSLFSCAPVWAMAPHAKPVGVRLEFATALKRSFSVMEDEVEPSQVAEPPTPRPKARPVPSAPRAVFVQEEAPVVVDEMVVDTARDGDEVEVESVGSVEVPSDDGGDVGADAMDVDDGFDMAPAPVPAVDVIDFTDSSVDEVYDDEADELDSSHHQLHNGPALAGVDHQLDGDDELLGSDEDSGAESDDHDGEHLWHDHHATPRQRGWGSDAMATPRPFPRASTAAHPPPPRRSLFSAGAHMSWSDNDPVEDEDVDDDDDDDDVASDGSGPIVLDDSSDEEQLDELVSPSTALSTANVPIKREPAEDVPIKHEPPTWDEDVAMDEDDDEYASADEEDWAEEYDAQDPWAGYAAPAQPAWTQSSRPAATEVVTVDSTDDEADQSDDDDGPIDLISSSPSPPASPIRHRAPSPAPVPPTPIASAPTFAAVPAVLTTPAPVARTPSAALLDTPVHEPPTKKVKLFTVPHVNALATPRPAVAPTAAARHAFGTAFTPPAADRAATVPNDDEDPTSEEEEDAPAEPAAGGGFLAGFLKGILSAWRPPSFF